MRRALLALLAAGAVAGTAVAVARERHDDPTPRPAAGPRRLTAQALPPLDAAIPRTPVALAAAVTDTTRRLRRAIGRWNAARAAPRDVTYLALYHQRMLRLMSARRALGDVTLPRVAPDVRDEVRDTVLGRRQLAAIPRAPGRLPRVRVAPAAPAARLRAFYAEGERRFGVPWSILAAVNFVESAFGRIRSASAAGARGPMQFLPSTWRAYGMGGDIDDPHDAVLAAANLLRRAGASRDLNRALFAYNHSAHYVRAIRLFAAQMAADERTFLTYYAWQVYVRTPAGVRRLTGPGRA
jgi:membrane-bound lytic murein transglycosylase B